LGNLGSRRGENLKIAAFNRVASAAKCKACDEDAGQQLIMSIYYKSNLNAKNVLFKKQLLEKIFSMFNKIGEAMPHIFKLFYHISLTNMWGMNVSKVELPLYNT
jgi:hypothetical protein